MRIAKICLNAVIFIAILCYPFVLFVADSNGIFAILAVLMFAFGLKFIIFGDNLSLVSAIFFVISISWRFMGLEIAMYFYPTLINIAFCVVFAMSLRGEAIITRFAKLQNPKLDSKGIIYTRNLTKLWCGVFIFNASVAGVLASFEDKIYWSIFSGFVSYLLVGLFFGGEFLYRNFIFKRRVNGLYK